MIGLESVQISDQFSNGLTQILEFYQGERQASGSIKAYSPTKNVRAL